MKKYIISGLFLAIIFIFAPSSFAHAETYNPCQITYYGQNNPCSNVCNEMYPSTCHIVYCGPSSSGYTNCPTTPDPVTNYCQTNVLYALNDTCTCPSGSTYTRFGYQDWNGQIRFKCVPNDDPTPPTYCQVNTFYAIGTKCTCPTNSTYTTFGYQLWNNNMKFKCVSEETPTPVPPTYFCQLDTAYPLATQCTCPTNSTYTRYGYQGANGGIVFKCVSNATPTPQYPTPTTYKMCSNGSWILTTSSCPVEQTHCSYDRWGRYTCSSENTNNWNYGDWNNYDTQSPYTYNYDNYNNYNDVPGIYDWSSYTSGYSY